jgi:hypothetical protein
MANKLAVKRPRTRNIIIVFTVIAILIASAYIYQIVMEGSRVKPSLSIIGLSQETVPLYGTIEINLNVTARFENPFDSEEKNVAVVLTSPSMRITEVPAFYYQEYSRSLTENGEALSPQGSPYWKVRFTPTEVGEYAFYAKLANGGQTETTDSFRFNVTSSSSRGFVRLSENDPRFFQFDDDSSFFFVGHDVCWSGSRGTFDYDEWFESMNQNGETITRIWMAPWVFGIEWKELGTHDLAEAWRLDYVLKLAEEKGIYVLLCFMNHGQLQSSGDTGQWSSNPYNTANNGPLEKPEDFWTNNEAIDLFKRRLRYIVSRWGYSTSILAWELWNEVELTDNYDFETVAEWHNQMADFLRQLDPHSHLVTTSSDSNFGDEEYIDFLTVHRYGPTGFLDIGGTVHNMISELIDQYQKPVLLSEFGADWRWFGDSYTTKDTEGIQIHNGVWSSVHSGSAASAMLWWWDNYIHPNNLYYHFKALSSYLEGIRPDEAGFRQLEARLVSPGEVAVEDLCDVTVYPSLGWARPEANLFEVDMYGNIGNLSRLSAYVQGRYHPELRNNPVFIVNLTYSGEAVFHVNSVASAGAVLNVYIDGSLNKTVSLPDRDGENDGSANEYNLDVAVQVPAGRHEIRLDNAGNDWFTIDYVRFTRAALKLGKARIIGLTNDTFAIVWIQNKDHTWWNVVNKVPIDAVESVNFELLGFRDGEYAVEWWNTYTGEIIRRDTVQAANGKILLTIERLEKDIAIKLQLQEP